MKPGFLEYQWRECVKSGLFGSCREWKANVEFYDLHDSVIREMIINKGFVVIVEKILK